MKFFRFVLDVEVVKGSIRANKVDENTVKGGWRGKIRVVNLIIKNESTDDKNECLPGKKRVTSVFFSFGNVYPPVCDKQGTDQVTRACYAHSHFATTTPSMIGLAIKSIATGLRGFSLGRQN